VVLGYSFLFPLVQKNIKIRPRNASVTVEDKVALFYPDMVHIFCCTYFCAGTNLIWSPSGCHRYVEEFRRLRHTDSVQSTERRSHMKYRNTSSATTWRIIQWFILPSFWENLANLLVMFYGCVLWDIISPSHSYRLSLQWMSAVV